MNRAEHHTERSADTSNLASPPAEEPRGIARREHVVTDQGNGGSYCSHCRYSFGSDPSKEFDACPNCQYQIVEGDISIQQGGSDFPLN